MMKKVLSIVFAALLCVIFATGCALSDDEKKEEEYRNRPNKMTMVYFNSGFGNKWLKDTAEYYMDNIDTSLYIERKDTVLNPEEGQKTVSGLSTGDLNVLQYGFFRQSGTLTDLSDVWERNAYGEDRTLKSKTSKLYADYYNEDGKYYMVPWAKQMNFSFAYNKTTLDSLLGAGQYVLPRTTDEMLSLGDTLKGKDCYLTALALYDNNDYLQYAIQVWLAQMLGYETRENIINGHVLNSETGEYELALNGEFLGDKSIETALNKLGGFLGTLLRKQNGYAHADSSSMRFMDVQATLCGLNFGTNKRKTAMLFNGSWLEQEMEYLTNEAEETIGKQELRVMRQPVMSGIIERTKSIGSEEKLREVIDYVDGVTEGKSLVKPTDVTDADLAIITEARNMVATSLLSSMVVPKTAKNPEAAKDFISFLASDIAQEIALKATKGLAMLPFGHYDSEDVELTGFMSDIKRITDDKSSVMIDYANFNKPFTQSSGFSLLYTGTSGLLQANIFTGFIQQSSLDNMHERMYAYFNRAGKWDSMLSAYYAAIAR